MCSKLFEPQERNKIKNEALELDEILIFESDSTQVSIQIKESKKKLYLNQLWIFEMGMKSKEMYLYIRKIDNMPNFEMVSR